MAFNIVVLPAPFGPMIPRMRPSSTRRSTLSTATVVPKILRRPRASIVAITLFPPHRFAESPLRCSDKFFAGDAESLNLRRHARPFLIEKFLTLALQQQIARAG